MTDRDGQSVIGSLQSAHIADSARLVTSGGMWVNARILTVMRAHAYRTHQHRKTATEHGTHTTYSGVARSANQDVPT